MAYTLGDTILDDEYNVFAWGNANGTINNTNDNVNTVLGAGSGDRGYGQTDVAAVSAGATITATQWASLLNEISTLANHQGSSITAITNPVATDQIKILSALAGNITTITSNRLDAAANGTPITSGGAISRTTGWSSTLSFLQHITFASAAAKRYFFNAGGRITMSMSRTGGSAENKNTGWSNLCTACGTINITGEGTSKTIGGTAYTGTTKIGGSGTPTVLLTGTGVNDYVGTDTTIFKQWDTTVDYTLNNLDIRGKSVDATSIDLSVNLFDDADANTDETVDGTLTVTTTVIPPSTTYLSSTWGTPTMSGSVIGS